MAIEREYDSKEENVALAVITYICTVRRPKILFHVQHVRPVDTPTCIESAGRLSVRSKNSPCHTESDWMIGATTTMARNAWEPSQWQVHLINRLLAHHFEWFLHVVPARIGDESGVAAFVRTAAECRLTRHPFRACRRRDLEMLRADIYLTPLWLSNWFDLSQQNNTLVMPRSSV